MIDFEDRYLIIKNWFFYEVVEPTLSFWLTRWIFIIITCPVVLIYQIYLISTCVDPILEIRERRQRIDKDIYDIVITSKKILYTDYKFRYASGGFCAKVMDLHNKKYYVWSPEQYTLIVPFKSMVAYIPDIHEKPKTTPWITQIASCRNGLCVTWKYDNGVRIL
jgi:hypothetical protein